MRYAWEVRNAIEKVCPYKFSVRTRYGAYYPYFIVKVRYPGKVPRYGESWTPHEGSRFYYDVNDEVSKELVSVLTAIASLPYRMIIAVEGKHDRQADRRHRYLSA